MTQEERRLYLIGELLREMPEYADTEAPASAEGQKRLLRGLLNVRAPGEASGEFLRVQDAYLRQALAERGVTDYKTLDPVEPGIYVWLGDITTLRCDAIVNAANSGLTGCYRPNHRCIDNCVHTFAGVRLRRDCGRLMAAQGHEEPPGRAKITKAYNLPCRYVLHTVGPIVRDRVTDRDRALLASCYRSCLDLAAENDLYSVAFCCISTGVFRFPRREAAEIAVKTARAWQKAHPGGMEVIFNVFHEADYEIYRDILGQP